MWRDSGRSVRFFLFDGRSSIFVVIFLAQINKITFFIMIASFIFFWLLERVGYTFPNAFRALKLILAGKNKRTNPWWMKNRYK